MLETDSSLIRRVRDPADAESWREFVSLYEPLLRRYARTLGVSEQDAPDGVQEVFAALVRALPGFELDHSRGRFRTWLWQVTRNTLANWMRRQGRQLAAEEEWRRRYAEKGGPSGSDAGWDESHHQRVLEFALERVRAETQPRTWACFEQHLLRGRSSTEVAVELGMTANAVYVNASRVLARLRERCADYLEELGNA